MNECKCIICGQMKTPPMGFHKMVHFICNECQEKIDNELNEKSYGFVIEEAENVSE